LLRQDHPDDRAWLKHVFDFVTNNTGELRFDKTKDLLECFYRFRSEGPTQSGSYLYSVPDNELKFVNALYVDGTTSINFATLMDALMSAQGARRSRMISSRLSFSRGPRSASPLECCAHVCARSGVPLAADFAEPAAPLEYGSNLVMRNDRVKHTRNVLHPQQQFRKPMTTSQEVGWELLTQVAEQPAPEGTPFHLRTSATTQFADAMEKQTWGRSIGGEFSAYAARKLAEFGGLGMGV